MNSVLWNSIEAKRPVIFKYNNYQILFKWNGKGSTEDWGGSIVMLQFGIACLDVTEYFTHDQNDFYTLQHDFRHFIQLFI